MSEIRILHIDDEPDIRAVVELSLGLDGCFAVRGVRCGRDAVAAATAWPPHLILLDAVMPGMDGPETLATLRAAPQTAGIPVVFMTARAQAEELEYLRSLGALGVIVKPFDPMTLAGDVRAHLRSAGIAALRKGFMARLHGDACALIECRSRLTADAASSRAALGEIKAFAHALAGAAGIFGLMDVSCTAATLERAASLRLQVADRAEDVEGALDALMSSIACAEGSFRRGGHGPGAERAAAHQGGYARLTTGYAR
jgi:CheY-like chemotaxis protein